MRNTLRAILFALLLLPSAAWAQCNSTTPVPSNTVLGRLGIGSGPCQAITFATLLANISAVPTSRNINTTSPLTGGGNLSADLTLSLGTQSANTVLSGPTTGSAAAPAFRALVGADLPNPGASSLGGAQSKTCSTHNWFNSLSTGGIFACTQPAFSDISGSIASTQLPTPGASTLGAVQSIDCSSGGQFLQKINTDGTETCATPAGGGNVSSSGTPTVHQTGVWVTSTSEKGVGPGTAGQQLTSNGAADPSFQSGGWVLLNTLTANNTATNLDDTTSLTATYNEYEIELYNFTCASSAQTIEFNVQSGGTFQGSGYLGQALSGNGTTAASQSVTSGVPIGIVSGCSTTAPGISGTYHISVPSGTSFAKVINGFYSENTSTPAAEGGQSGGYWNSSAAITGLRIITTSGNLATGTFKIYGRL